MGAPVSGQDEPAPDATSSCAAAERDCRWASSCETTCLYSSSGRERRAACRGLAELYLGGCGVPQDVERGKGLLRVECERADEESCARLRALSCGGSPDAQGLEARCRAGDHEACSKRVGLDSDGCHPFADAASAGPILERGCERGDDEACRRLALLLCRSDAPLPSLPARALRPPGDAPGWDAPLLARCEGGEGGACRQLGLSERTRGREPARSCLLLKRACELGDAWGCLAEADVHSDRSGIAPEQERELRLRGRVADRLQASCDQGNPYACLYVASSLEPVSSADTTAAEEIRRRARARGQELCASACADRDAEACLALAERYASVVLPIWIGDVSACRRELARQAANRFDASCSAGDVAACERLAEVAGTRLADSARQEAAHWRAAALGSEKAREIVARIPGARRGPALTGLVGLGYGPPTGFGGSVGLIVGSRLDERGSDAAFSWPQVGGSGALIALEAGTSGASLSVGWARALAIRDPPDGPEPRFRWALSPVCAGYAVRATVARGWDGSDSLLPGRTYVGGAVDAGFLLKVSIGALTTVDGPRDTRLVWRVGLGF
jgi:hypothetical protein